MIDPLLNPGRWPHPDVPAWQMLRILTLACLQLMDDYWIQYIHPAYTLKFAESIDVQRLFQMCVGADTHSWSEHTQDHLHLLSNSEVVACGLQQIGAMFSL